MVVAPAEADGQALVGAGYASATFRAQMQSTLPPAKIGLGVFLAVAGCLFALLISAYFMRVDLDSFNFLGGVPRPVPKLLWLNTGVLVCSSVALQWAWVEARRGRMDAVRSGLLIGAVSAIAFVAGQLLAWRQLTQAGYFLTSSPVTSFFYLIDRRAWAACAGRPGGLAPERRPGMAVARRRRNCASASSCARSTGIFCCWSGWSCSLC